MGVCCCSYPSACGAFGRPETLCLGKLPPGTSTVMAGRWPRRFEDGSAGYRGPHIKTGGSLVAKRNAVGYIPRYRSHWMLNHPVSGRDAASDLPDMRFRG